MNTAVKTSAWNRGCPQGFTLVEILIVVVILSILATIVLPAFSSATRESREKMLMEDLRVIRHQIGCYKIQHGDKSPGYPVGGGDPSAAVFVQQLSGFTNAEGDVAAAKDNEYRYGPYLREIPQNTVNSLNDVLIVGDGEDMPNAPGEGIGWIFKPESSVLRSGAQGTDTTGRAYYEY